MEKIYISANDLLLDSFKLAEKIYRSGFRPDFIIGVWRGGAPIGIAVHEYFDCLGTHCNHIPIRTSSYTGIAEQNSEVKVHGLDFAITQINTDTNLLIVDDVFDSGKSIKTIYQELKKQAGNNCPRVIKSAMPWYKPDNNQTDMAPDYYIHSTDKWLVFPHELKGLSLEEIEQGKGDIAQTIIPLLRKNQN